MFHPGLERRRSLEKGAMRETQFLWKGQEGVVDVNLRGQKTEWSLKERGAVHHYGGKRVPWCRSKKKRKNPYLMRGGKKRKNLASEKSAYFT